MRIVAVIAVLMLFMCNSNAALSGDSEPITKVKNLKPYLEGYRDLVLSVSPGSILEQRIEAKDPESEGVYVVLDNSSPISGATCRIDNATTLHCSAAKMTLSKADKCCTDEGWYNGGKRNSSEAVSACSRFTKQTVDYCKHGFLKMRIYDSGVSFSDGTKLAAKESKIYSVPFRIIDVQSASDSTETDAKKRSSLELAPRSFLSDMKKDWKDNSMPWMNGSGRANSNKDAALSYLPDYANVGNDTDANVDYEALNNRGVRNDANTRQALTGKDGEVGPGGVDKDFANDMKDLVLTNSPIQLESLPIACKISREGVAKSKFYVCTLDANYPNNMPATAKFYAFDGNDQAAKDTCLKSCNEKATCSNLSVDREVVYFKDINKLSKLDMKAIIGGLSATNLVSSVKIEKRNKKGELIYSHLVALDRPVLENTFKWIELSSGNNKSSKVISRNFSLDAGTNPYSVYAHNEEFKYWVEPRNTYYIAYKYQGRKYTALKDDMLYTLSFIEDTPTFYCDLIGSGLENTFSTQSECDNTCYKSASCVQESTFNVGAMEKVENSCTEKMIKANGSTVRLKDAVDNGICVLESEDSLTKSDDSLSVADIATRFYDFGSTPGGGRVLDARHPSFEFETSSKTFRNENSFSMASAFLEMIQNGESEGRFTKTTYDPLNFNNSYINHKGEMAVDDGSDVDAFALLTGPSRSNIDIDAVITLTPTQLKKSRDDNQKYGAIFFKLAVDKKLDVTDSTEPVRLEMRVLNASEINAINSLNAISNVGSELTISVYNTQGIGLVQGENEISEITSIEEMNLLEQIASTYDRRYVKKVIKNIQAGSFPSVEKDDVLAVIEGLIDIKEDDFYNFAIDGSDAIDLYIDGNHVVDWYGAHNSCGCMTKRGTIKLAKGLHSIKMRVYDKSGEENYTLYIQKSEITNAPKIASPMGIASEDYFVHTNGAQTTVASSWWVPFRKESAPGAYRRSSLSIDAPNVVTEELEFGDRPSSVYARTINSRVKENSKYPFFDYDMDMPVYMTRIESDVNTFSNALSHLFVYMDTMENLETLTVAEAYNIVKQDYISGKRRYSLWDYRDMDEVLTKNGVTQFSGMEGREFTQYKQNYSPNDFRSFWINRVLKRDSRVYVGSIDDTIRIQMAMQASVTIKPGSLQEIDSIDAGKAFKTTNGTVLICPDTSDFNKTSELCEFSLALDLQATCEKSERFNTNRNRCESALVCPAATTYNNLNGLCEDDRGDAIQSVLFAVKNITNRVKVLEADKIGKEYHYTLDFNDINETYKKTNISDYWIEQDAELYIEEAGEYKFEFDSSDTFCLDVEHKGTIVYTICENNNVVTDESGSTVFEKGSYKFLWGSIAYGDAPYFSMKWSTPSSNGNFESIDPVVFGSYRKDVMPTCKANSVMDITQGVCVNTDVVQYAPSYDNCDKRDFSYDETLLSCTKPATNENNCSDTSSAYNWIKNICIYPAADIKLDDSVCPPSMTYSYDSQKCISQPFCYAGGVYDPKTEQCSQSTRMKTVSRNGYYFAYLKEKSGNFGYFLTPIEAGESITCNVNFTVCGATQQVFSSEDSCKALCFTAPDATNALSPISKVNSECIVGSENPDEDKTLMNSGVYASKDYCKNECYAPKEDIIFPSINLKWSRRGVSPNFRGGAITIKRKGINDIDYSTLISAGGQTGIDVGRDNKGVEFFALKAGESIEITYEPTNASIENGLKYYRTGFGYWDETEADNQQLNLSKEIVYNGHQCKNLDGYFSDNYFALDIDKEMDNIYEDSIRLGSGFICTGLDRRTVKQVISFDGKQIKYEYVDMFGEIDNTITYPLTYNDLGECSESNDMYSEVYAHFGNSVEDKFLNDKITAVKAPNAPGNGIESAVNVYFPMAKRPIKLGVVKVDLSPYSPNMTPDELFKVLKDTSELPIAFWNGVFSSDYFYAIFKESGLKKTVLENTDLYAGYGYETRGECRDFTPVPPYTYSTSVLDIKPLGLDGTCPTDYEEESSICLKRHDITSTTDQITVCRPWWKLLRTYMCDGTDNLVNDISDDFSFAYPRWVDRCEKIETFYKSLGDLNKVQP